MGLDIRFKRQKDVICPKCGEIIGYTNEHCVSSGGRMWYPLLEKFGYYVPVEQRTEENDWYGKDMKLTPEQTKKAYQFVKNHELYDGIEIAQFIATAMYEGDVVVINADW